MAIEYFKNFFNKRNFVLEEMRKDDLNLKINCGFDRFDESNCIEDLWQKKNANQDSYKVFLLKEKMNLMGLISFSLGEEFYFSDYEKFILEEIKKGNFFIPKGIYFYLSRILVQKPYQSKKIGKILMNFIFYFINMLKENKDDKIILYIFTLKNNFDEFFKKFEWDHKFTVPCYKELIYVLYKKY